MDLKITGRKALVTGGDSGIGWHTARALLDEGVVVVLTDRDEVTLNEAATALRAPEGALHAFPADITDLRSLGALRSRVEDAVGDIDILVQSAGVTGAQGLFHEIDDEGWVSTIETDLLGPVRVVREFLPALRSGGWGRLVLVASEDAVQPYDDELPYCAAKAGVLALAKGLSRTYASEGLLVNAVSPAFIHTPMTDAMMAKRADEHAVLYQRKRGDEPREPVRNPHSGTRSHRCASAKVAVCFRVRRRCAERVGALRPDSAPALALSCPWKVLDAARSRHIASSPSPSSDTALGPGPSTVRSGVVQERVTMQAPASAQPHFCRSDVVSRGRAPAATFARCTTPRSSAVLRWASLRTPRPLSPDMEGTS